MSNKILDLEVLKENYEGDEDLLLSARDVFLDNYEPLYTAIGNAAESGDLRQLSDSSHALKGSTGIFWPKNLQEILQAIETSEDSVRLETYKQSKEKLATLMEQLITELKALQLQDLVA